MIEDWEHVARVIFSPKIIYKGRLLAEAFELRAQLREDYVSVLRMAVDGWMNDMYGIPERRNRALYGYADMNVGEIRALRLRMVEFDVKETNYEMIRSHAGIFIRVNGEQLIGGQHLTTLPEGASEDFILLAIKQQLALLAQRGLHQAG